MDTNDNLPTPGDENVERLIGEAYRPEPIDLRFAERTLQKLQELADERKEGRLPWRQLTWLYFANAAAVLLLIVVPPLFWRFFMNQPQRDQAAKQKEPSAPPEHLAPRPRGTASVPPCLEIGQTVGTEAGQKRKVRLPDDSVVSLNHGSSVRLDAARQLTLLGGEVFVEVAPAGKKSPFVIHTPNREVTALGTKLAVRNDQRGTSVLVTQGRVKVSGVEDVVGAGQVVEANAANAPAWRSTGPATCLTTTPSSLPATTAAAR
jgi:FecR protein